MISVSVSISPSFTKGYTKEMKPLAWQPGLAMRFSFATAERKSQDSSGKPYAQPSAVLCAVEASMIFVFGF